MTTGATKLGEINGRSLWIWKLIPWLLGLVVSFQVWQVREIMFIRMWQAEKSETIRAVISDLGQAMDRRDKADAVAEMRLRNLETSMPDEVPPAWFKAEVDRIGERQQLIIGQVAGLVARVDSIEHHLGMDNHRPTKKE